MIVTTLCLLSDMQYLGTDGVLVSTFTQVIRLQLEGTQTLLVYFHFLLLYISIPLHFGGQCCTFLTALVTSYFAGCMLNLFIYLQSDQH